MLAPSCCIRSEGHKCDLILVWGEALRALLSSPSVDAAIWTHVDGPLDAETPVRFFCRDDLIAHLGNATIKDYLEDYLAMILDISKKKFELGLERAIREDLACLSPVATEDGSDNGDPFVDAPDTEPLAPKDCHDNKRPLFKTTGKKRKALQTYVAFVREKMGSCLRHDYRRKPSKSKIPVCAPRDNRSTSKKCVEAVENEW
jgi:hypothetical protein